MLHLDARIHLDEVPLPALGIHQEFHRAGVVVSGRACQLHSRIGKRAADGRVERHRRRHFHHFLMAPLHRAIAFVEVQDVALTVAQNLDFDVPGMAYETLDEDRVVAERRRGFAAGFFQQPREIRGLLHHAHAPSSAAEGRFQNEREADLACDLFGLPRVVDRLLGARNHRNPRLLSQAARRGLVAQQFQKVRGGSNERNPGAFAGARQRGVLGQESIARMNGVHALLPRQRDDALDVEVGLHGPFAFAHQIRFVGLEPVERQAVFLGVNGDRAQTQFIGRAQNTNGDFTAIEGENFFHFSE